MTSNQQSGGGSPRKAFPFRFDLLPYAALKEAASIYYGANDRYPNRHWRTLPLTGEHSSYNHGLGHLLKAGDEAPASDERIRQLAKALVNIVNQLDVEINHRDKSDPTPMGPPPEVSVEWNHRGWQPGARVYPRYLDVTLEPNEPEYL